MQIIYMKTKYQKQKTGKDVVDYITDQIDKVVNDKKENEK